MDLSPRPKRETLTADSTSDPRLPMPLEDNAQTTIRPFDAIMLSVGDGHWIYVEQVGTPGAMPALFLHGGPGSGAQHMHRRLFAPERFHAILFDQRGAGRSHPYLGTRDNTTQHLVADIEAIRQYFGFEKMMIVGGSWGSTLALAYAEAHPTRVSGLVLRAIFLGTAAEIQWAFIDGPRIFRPDLFSDFVAFLPEDERADPLAAYIHRLTSKDPSIRDPAAHVWNAYERTLSELAPHAVSLKEIARSTRRLPPTPIMEAHYIRNHFFLKPGQILANAHRLSDIPGAIVQGRHDLLCPPQNANALAKAWPQVRLQFVETAGHSMTEAGVEAAIVAAIDEISRSTI